MNYSEACEVTISRDQAIKEIRKHSLNPSDFLFEVGVKDNYSGKEVLDWLGY